MSTRRYSRFECRVCGKWISSAGVSKTNHYRMHVREGYMVEKFVGFYPHLGLYGRCEFYFTEAGKAYRKERLKSSEVERVETK